MRQVEATWGGVVVSNSSEAGYLKGGAV